VDDGRWKAEDEGADARCKYEDFAHHLPCQSHVVGPRSFLIRIFEKTGERFGPTTDKKPTKIHPPSLLSLSLPFLPSSLPSFLPISLFISIPPPLSYKKSSTGQKLYQCLDSTSPRSRFQTASTTARAGPVHRAIIEHQ